MTTKTKSSFVFTHGNYVEFLSPQGDSFIMMSSADVDHNQIIEKMPYLKALSGGFSTTLSAEEVLLYGQSRDNALKSSDTKEKNKQSFRGLRDKTLVVCELVDGTKLLTNALKPLVESGPNIHSALEVKKSTTPYEFHLSREQAT